MCKSRLTLIGNGSERVVLLKKIQKPAESSLRFLQFLSLGIAEVEMMTGRFLRDLKRNFQFSNFRIFLLRRSYYYYVLNSVFGGAEIHDTNGTLHESMYGVPRSNDNLSLEEIIKNVFPLL